MAIVGYVDRDPNAAATNGSKLQISLGRGLRRALLLPLSAIALGLALLYTGINPSDPRTTGWAAATPANARYLTDQFVSASVTTERLNDGFSAQTAAVAAAAKRCESAYPPKTSEPAKIATGQKPVTKTKGAKPKQTPGNGLFDNRRPIIVARMVADRGSLSRAIGDSLVARNDFLSATTAKPTPPQLDQAEICQLIKGWLTEVERDSTVASIMTTSVTPPLEEQAVAEMVAQLLSVESLNGVLKKGLASEFETHLMGNGVALWSKDVSARLLWAITAFVFCGTFAFVVTSALAQFRQLVPTKAKAYRWTALFIAFALGSVVAWLSSVNVNEHIAPLTKALAFFDQRYQTHMSVWAAILNGVAMAGAVLLLSGSVATLLVKVTTPDDIIADLKGMKTLFNAGVVFLFAGALEVGALFRWPSVFYLDESTRQAILGIAASISTTAGAFFSVVLLAMYLSTIVVLRAQAEALPTPADVDTAKKAFDANGFGEVGSQQFLRAVQMLLPLLGGATVGLLDLLRS